MHYSYQKENKKKRYQLDNEDVKNFSKSFYMTFDFKSKEVNYSDKGFNKVVTNFVEIEAICSKCSFFFPFKL